VTAYRFIDAEKANEPVRLLCRMLGVSRAAFYAWKAGTTWSRGRVRDAALAVHIRAIWKRARETYGSPRVTVELKSEGHVVGRRRVARVMQEHGLKGTPSKRFRGSTTDSKHTALVAPNLLERDFTANEPNRVWVGDITYLPTRAGWVYLAVLLDLFSRKVVGWELASHMRDDLCLGALRRAIATRSPAPGLIHHTDRGSQYASSDYQRALSDIAAMPSMSRKGDCWDNACAESFFGTLEQELGGKADWADEAEARAAVGAYIHKFYNPVRRHRTLGQVSPVAFEEQYRVHQTKAA
jgi:putative transposase